MRTEPTARRHHRAAGISFIIARTLPVQVGRPPIVLESFPTDGAASDALLKQLSLELPDLSIFVEVFFAQIKILGL